MILQRLVEYYDRLAADPHDPMTPSGFSREKISFALVITPVTNDAELFDLRETQGKKPFPRIMTVPDRGGRQGTGLKPNFLWDNSGYVLGRDSKGNADRSRQAFESFRDFHVKMAETIGDPELAAVAKFLAAWSPETADALKGFKDALDKNIVFRLKGQMHFVHESSAISQEWKAPVPEDEKIVLGQSLVGGEIGPLARLHPLIGGVKDAQTMGAALASFNLDAFTSYGLTQTYNAPVSVSDTFKYTTALNRLLESRARRVQIGDATVVFWADEPTPLEDFAADFFGDAPLTDEAAEDKDRARQARLFLSQLRDGHASADAFDAESRVGFFILGLSPNASRISVRFWVQTDVAEMKRRLAQHLADLDLVGRRDGDDSLNVRRLVSATGRAEFSAGKHKGYDTDAVSPLLSGAVARAIFTGNDYPRTLLTAMLNRLRADGAISHVRVAAIKACLVRSDRTRYPTKESLVALDPARTDPAYVTGRLFALLEKIQSDSAGGELNATIKDRYFSAASATPGLVFPRLLRLSQHHLAKMETGTKIYYERQLGEAIGKLSGFARNFMLEDQGLFTVGYFHQRQDLFTPRKPKDAPKEGTAE